jgi:uncharacterized C2H2 Zn-finger protein
MVLLRNIIRSGLFSPKESSSEALSWLYSGYTKLSIECPACGASFTDAVEMTSHVNQVHLELEEGRKMKVSFENKRCLRFERAYCIYWRNAEMSNSLEL